MKKYPTAETLSLIKPPGAAWFEAGYSHRSPAASSAHWGFRNLEDAKAFLLSLKDSPYRITLRRFPTGAGLRWIVAAPCAPTGHLIQIFWHQ